MMFSDVAYPQRNRRDVHSRFHSRPHQLENRAGVGYLDSLPTSPAVTTPRELPYNGLHVWRSGRVFAESSGRDGSPLQRTNSFPPQKPDGSPRDGRLDASEHMLRRKTPSGTLAAGYDGTPVEWASNSHAIKDVLVPSPNINNAQMAHQRFPPSFNQYRSLTTAANHTRPEHAKLYGHTGHGNWEAGSEDIEKMMRVNCLHKPEYSPGIDSFLDQVPGHRGLAYLLPNGQQVPTVMQPTWQPCPGPTASDDPGPYGPYWPNGSFVPYRPAALRDPRFFSHAGRAWVPANGGKWTNYRERGWQSAVGPRSFTPTNNDDPGPYPQQLTFDRAHSSDMPPSTEYPFRHPPRPYVVQESRATYELDDGTRGYQAYLGRATQHRPPAPNGRDTGNQEGSHTGYSTPLTSVVHYDKEQPPVPELGLMASDAQFKEKVLSWAHRVYIDLLASLHQSRRASLHGKHVDSRQNLLRANIYPRPPRQPLSDFSTQFSNQSSLSDRSPPAQDSCRMTHEEHISKKPRQDDGHHHCFAGVVGNGRHRDSLSFPSTDSVATHQNDHRYRERLPPTFSFQSSTPGGFCNIRRLAGARPSLPTTPSEQGPSSSSDAVAALEMLTRLCQESGWLWIDGMLLGGCLAYGLGEYNKASRWYSRILTNDPSHVEAMSNLAASLLSLNRREEAEQYWLRSVRLRPSFFEATEHLIGLLCGDQRGKQAVGIIDYVEGALRLDRHGECQKAVDGISETSSEKSRSPSVSMSEVSDRLTFDFDLEDDTYMKANSEVDATRCQPGFGSSGYAIPGSENGRMLALVHAKGNMLYGLGDNAGAAKAFEDAVLIGSGRRQHGIHGLIKRILTVVSHEATSETKPIRTDGHCKEPVLLLPEKALQTSKLVFPAQGELPGLRDVPQGIAKRAAISTTSNSLLSLAKIYQDGMSSSAAPTSGPRATSGVRDILALYYLSLALQPSPSTANNVGILLASVQPSAPFKTPISNVSQRPAIPGITPGSGIALALAYYNYGLNLDSRHAHLYTNLGSLLKDIGQLAAAIKMYEQAVACDGSFDIALANLANAVKDQGRISDAINYYRRAVAASPDFAEAVCGLANALNSVCGWTGRGGVVFSGNGKRDQWHVDDQGMPMDARIVPGKGSGWIKRVVDIVEKQLRDGESWGRGLLRGESLDFVLKQLEAADVGASWSTVRRKSLRNAIQQWTGRSWEGAKAVRLVERATKLLSWWWYQERYVQDREYRAARYTRPQLPGILAVPSAPTVLPFHTFTCPLSADQVRKISQRNALRISCSTLRAPWLSKTVYRPPAPPRPHLNVGYVSSDFNNHPLAHLMQSVFGLHNPARVKAFCYATTASDNSAHRQQIEREAPRFYDASSWSIDVLVKQIVEDGIHILINLNGYTRGARNEVFAARPAPIQMSFMGFAGTLGAEWCDYLLADETAIPPETLRPGRQNVNLEDQMNDENNGDDLDEWIYSENIIFSRDTFFCCDHRQSAPDSQGKQLSWGEEQVRRWKMRKELFPDLADNAVILGNFNQLYKIDPTTFRSWLRILARLPNAVLWLLRFPELGESNLKQTAIRWAGSEVASRIIFTDVAPKHQHISRARVCDLFLDTPECNAHTTAADVLWSGTPLLTLPRYKYKMCSRMAASILKGALPQTAQGKAAAMELIADSDEEYEERAVALGDDLVYSTEPEELGMGHGRLVELRKILYESRWTSALFDTKRWVRDIEAAYAEAWRKWVAGEGGDIWL